MTQLLYFFLISSLTSFFPDHYFGQKKEKQPSYTLTADKVVLENMNSLTYNVKVTLHNSTADTLYFFSSNCSWRDFFILSNDIFIIDRPVCSADEQIVNSVPPNGNHIVELRLTRKKVIKLAPVFKVGFDLVKARNQKDRKDFDKLNRDVNLIWSNTTTI